MKINIKKLSEKAIIPSYATLGDAGLDLTATRKEYDKYGNICYGTDLCFEIPFGYVGLLFPRSSNSKKDLLLTNSVGVLDSGYRGEITFKYRPILKDGNFISDSENYNVGDKIGQLIILPYPQIELIETNELTNTERGTGSYGSTGA